MLKKFCKDNRFVKKFQMFFLKFPELEDYRL